MRIQGSVVLITGASQGIGAALAAELGRRGAKLALTARSAEGLERPGACAVAGDLTRDEDRRRVVEETLGHYGRIDILVNNAGVGMYAPAWKAPAEETRRMYELNVFAPLALTQFVAPQMRERHAGMVVNVGSIAGKVTLPWFTLYSSTKSAVAALTDGLRMELQRDGIRLMLVCPGYVRTRFQENVLAGRPPEKLWRGKKFAVTAAECAQAIAQGIERDARTVMTPAAGWLLVAAARLAPALVARQLCKINDGLDGPG